MTTGNEGQTGGRPTCKRRSVRWLWLVFLVLFCMCAAIIGLSRLFRQVDLLLAFGLLGTVILYFQDRVHGKNAYIGSMLVEADSKGGVARFVDQLTAVIGMGCAGYVVVACYLG